MVSDDELVVSELVEELLVVSELLDEDVVSLVDELLVVWELDDVVCEDELELVVSELEELEVG